MRTTELEYVQSKIGYVFKKSTLLDQAFKRKTYSKYCNNLELKLKGDYWLPTIVSEIMADYLDLDDEGLFTKIKDELICRKRLMNRIQEFGFQEMLKVGNGEKIDEQQLIELFKAIIVAVAKDSDYDIKVLKNIVNQMLNVDDYFETIGDSIKRKVSLDLIDTRKNSNKTEKELNLMETMKNWEYVQTTIGYTFKNRDLLIQAFTRRSYTEENKDALNNEVLEFYGDKALEFVVMKKLSKRFGEITRNRKYASQKSEGQLTEIKQNVVCKTTLSDCVDYLNFADSLLMGKGDEVQNIQNQESVKEDLFEAIIGAVAIDCGWDAVILEKVVDKMFNIEDYFEIEQNYINLIQTWCQKKYGKTPVYHFLTNNGGFVCGVKISDDIFIGCGLSKKEARMKAAEDAYRKLKEKNAFNDNLIDEVGKPSLEKAINQLQELNQKGYIGEITYNFSEDHYDRNGCLVWKGVCEVGNARFEATDNSKKECKKMVAYKMLCDILGWEENHEA